MRCLLKDGTVGMPLGVPGLQGTGWKSISVNSHLDSGSNLHSFVTFKSKWFRISNERERDYKISKGF